MLTKRIHNAFQVCICPKCTMNSDLENCPAIVGRGCRSALNCSQNHQKLEGGVTQEGWAGATTQNSGALHNTIHSFLWRSRPLHTNVCE